MLVFAVLMLIAMVANRAGRYFRLTLAPGTYLLESDAGWPDDCVTNRVQLRPGRTARVLVGVGCNVA